MTPRTSESIIPDVFGYTYWGGLSYKYAVGNPGQLDSATSAAIRAKVTISGESGGGGKASTRLEMPAAKGLFHRATVKSGPMLTAGDTQAATRKAKDILSKLNLNKAEELVKVWTADLFAAAGAGGRGAAPAPPATTTDWSEEEGQHR